MPTTQLLSQYAVSHCHYHKDGDTVTVQIVCATPAEARQRIDAGNDFVEPLWYWRLSDSNFLGADGKLLSLDEQYAIRLEVMGW